MFVTVDLINLLANLIEDRIEDKLFDKEYEKKKRKKKLISIYTTFTRIFVQKINILSFTFIRWKVSNAIRRSVIGKSNSE